MPTDRSIAIKRRIYLRHLRIAGSLGCPKDFFTVLVSADLRREGIDPDTASPSAWALASRRVTFMIQGRDRHGNVVNVVKRQARSYRENN